MEPTTNQFRYTPLEDASSQIRLVKVQVDPVDGSIACEISTWQLADAPKYAAISYTWGSAADVRMITVDGRAMQVRQNCVLALKHTTIHWPDPYFWIDSICIDQNDLDQKASQVGIMADIFEQADAVLAFVGPSADDSNLVVAFLRFLGEQRLDLPPLSTWDEETATKWTSFISVQLAKGPPEFAEAIIESLVEFSKRPWFSRLWVAQEIFVARRIFLCCGDVLTSMGDLYFLLNTRPFALIPMIHKYKVRRGAQFGRFRAIAEMVGVDFQQVHRYAALKERGLEWGDHVFSQDLYHLKKLVQLTNGLGDTPQRMGVRGVGQPHMFPYVGTFHDPDWHFRDPTQSTGLDAVQSLIGGLQCQDPRDMVFGTLRFVDWTQYKMIQPDYSIRPFDLALKVLESFRFGQPEHEKAFRLAEDLVRNLKLDSRDLAVAQRPRKRWLDTAAEEAQDRGYLTERDCHSVRLVSNESGTLSAALQIEVQGEEDSSLETWKQLDRQLLVDRAQPLFILDDLAGILCPAARPGDYLVQLHGETEPRAMLVVRESESSLGYDIVGLAALAPGVRVCMYYHQGGQKCECFKTFTIHFEDEEILHLAAHHLSNVNASATTAVDGEPISQHLGFPIRHSYASLEKAKETNAEAEDHHNRQLLEKLKDPEKRFVNHGFENRLIGQLFEDIVHGRRILPGLEEGWAEVVAPLSILFDPDQRDTDPEPREEDLDDFSYGPESHFMRLLEARKKQYLDQWKED